MAIYLRNRKLESLAREIAQETGQTITEALTRALEERLERLRYRRNAEDLTSQIMAISRRCAALPDIAPRGLRSTGAS